MLTIGHRGAAGYEPENTLRSFRKAVKLGVDMVELDVHLSKTGDLVVIHDETVDRTTNGNGAVGTITLSELKMLDAGSGERIPTLPEVLDAIGRQTRVNIELKSRDTAEPVMRLIEAYIYEKKWGYDNFLVSSFDHHAIARLHYLNPHIQTGAILVGIPIHYAQFAQEAGASSVHLSCEYISAEFVSDAHKRKMRVFTFTVNAGDEAERMRGLGVDGVFSDFPDRVHLG